VSEATTAFSRSHAFSMNSELPVGPGPTEHDRRGSRYVRYPLSKIFEVANFHDGWRTLCLFRT
jgi:hypothetical protein